MKELLDRLGFYDFLGIWGPGAITLTYYIFTLRELFEKAQSFLGISNPGISAKYLLVILYTVVAYMIGVIFHEVGKLFCDHVFGLTPQKCIRTADYLSASPVRDRGILREYKNTIEVNIPKEIYENTPFDRATAHLKYAKTIEKKKIDNYHAYYALARSLALCFGIETPENSV